jgi:N utilization substance protein B
VKGVHARLGEIDRAIEDKLAGMVAEPPRQADEGDLRAGTYELLARHDVPVGAVISEYVDVAHAEKRRSGFVNGLLDAIAKVART